MFSQIRKNEFLRFILIGGVNTLFGYSLFCLLIALKLPHLIAITLAFIGGTLFNFKTIGRFVFQSHDNQLIFKFFLVYFFLYFFNLVLIEVFRHMINNWYVNGGLTITIAALVSFALNKYWVFRPRSKSA